MKVQNWFHTVGLAVVLSLVMLVGFKTDLIKKQSAQAYSSSTLVIKQQHPVVNEGNQIILTATNADGQALSTVSWSSGSPDIAQVDTLTGVVRGVQQGFATVTATDGQASASVFVVVVRVRKGNANTIAGDTKVNQNGQIYISNPVENVILQASTALTTKTKVLAGKTGVRGLRDGSPKKALFAGPTALSLDERAEGGLYIADTLNHSLRKITYQNQVESILGTGKPGMSPFDAEGKVPFDQVQLNGLRGVVGNKGGNLFVADTDNHALYYVDSATRYVRILAGKPGERGNVDGPGLLARFSRPSALALSPDGRILAVVDQDNNRVRFLELTAASTGVLECQVSTIGIQKPALSTPGQAREEFRFNQPKSVSFDAVGNVVVVDATGVYVITDPVGQKSELIPLAQLDVSFKQPVSVTVKGAAHYVLDARGNRDTALSLVTVGAPEIDSLSQDQVQIEGGEELIVTGKNFAPESLVFVGDTQVTDLQVESATLIRLIVPRQLYHGRRVLSVQTRGGIAQSKLSIIPPSFSSLLPGDITTVAGGAPFIGAGGKATDAVLSAVSGVTLDSAGNLIVSDQVASQLLQVDSATGLITAIAGSGVRGLIGDGGPALASQLDFPGKVVFDRFGNIYIADRVNGRVRKVDALTSIITTVAGGGQSTQDGIPATEAALEFEEIAIDQSDNLLISGGYTGYIKRVDARSGLISTIAGNGKPEYFGDGGPASQAGINPVGMDFDLAGNLYVADYRNHRIRRIDAQTGIITTVAGTGVEGFSGDGGLATQAQLAYPTDIVLDRFGDLYICDSFNSRVRQVSAATHIIKTIVGTGDFGFSGDNLPGNKSALYSPEGIVVDGAGNLFIADLGNHRIRRWSASTGNVSTVAGGGNLSPSVLGTDAFINPTSIARGQAGTLLFTDVANPSVMKLDLNTWLTSRVAGTGERGASSDDGLALETRINPGAIFQDANQNLFIAEGNVIRMVDPHTGLIRSIAGNKDLYGHGGDGGLATEAGISAQTITGDNTGNLYFSEPTYIRKIDAVSHIITTIAGNGKPKFSGENGLATRAGMSPYGRLAFDKEMNLYFADPSNGRVCRIDSQTGILTTVAGKGGTGVFDGDGNLATATRLFSPTGIAFDESGNLFIADATRILRVDAQTKILKTIAGGTEIEGSGDGGSALNARFQVRELFFDASGNLFFTSFNKFGRVQVIKGIG